MQKNYVQRDLAVRTEKHQHASESETEGMKAHWNAEWSSRSDHWAGLNIQKRGRGDNSMFSSRLAGRVDSVRRDSGKSRRRVHGW